MCMCSITKYRVSFKLPKCNFLSDCVEYLGHNLLQDGNTTAKSKFNMIRDWQLPSNGQSLFSFIGLISFYHHFAPYHELRVKPLRLLVKQYFRKPIPSMVWTPTLIQLFNDLKVNITSSLVTARFDPTQPAFLQTDWSMEGMGWILMQTSSDTESRVALTSLKNRNMYF